MLEELETKAMATEEIKILNSMPIDSFINSLTSYELKLKSEVQDKEEARIKRSIAFEVSQEEDDDLLLLDSEYVKLEENGVTLMTKTIKKLFNNKRRFRRGRPNNSQFSNVIKVREENENKIQQLSNHMEWL